ncbi:winged helix-turn-helix transcriptional regulator [Haloglomus salinum]|jgi:hypothetical protein|uniref:winged helix-turn-helix transcriptional regulator n=1 Tax=Haloglomus salinum TaxID=2962673 RepID=UPI0020C99473|nr:winged helix-turn-helix transcriptional regulator [Haloglomus salinum]
MRIRPIPQEGTHVELYVGSLSPTDARDSQESILRRLQRTAAVDSIEVVVTGDHICPETVAASTEGGAVLLETLEAYGIVDREFISEKPFRVRYSLTERGHSLEPVIREMESWGKQHLTEGAHDSRP